MRVLTLTNMYPTPDEPWAGSFVKEQVDDLRALGVEIDVYHFDGRRDRFDYLRAAHAVRRIVRAQELDLIHAHFGLTGAVALAQRRVPVVTTFTGSDLGYVPWYRYVSWVVARATTPVFVTPAGARRVGCADAEVVPAGVDLELFAPRDRDDARRALGWDTAATYVLFPASKTRPVKRFDLFADAVRDLGRAGVDVRSMTLENVDRPTVAAMMNAADVTVLTSDSEGSPITVKESLASATPVVSVDVGDVGDVLAGLPGCAVVDRDAAALAAAIAAAIDAGKSGVLRQRAEAYGRRATAERMLTIFERAAARRR